MPIPKTVMIRIASRPIVLPIGLNTTEPNGWNKKATAKTANDDNSDTPAAVEEKNMTNDHCKVAIDSKIEPLNEIADAHGKRPFAQFSSFA
ncbi:hypothetical protein [Pseudomonas sp. RIT-PI-q]|uniref:hypothetical protein n=1 Tax=Pseudomonas sp. RIT-PI-q TaxID=1690247 RepID=UPI0015A75109|nr:hypothetical protein [Pseudomonas sp. RIT-PI-q]